MDAIAQFQQQVGGPVAALALEYWYVLLFLGIVLVWYLIDSEAFSRGNGVTIELDGFSDGDGGGGDGGGGD